MGFLDRIASLMGRADSGSADPKGPLGLMPGDEISYYQERFHVTGIRIIEDAQPPLFHYRLEGLGGGSAVLAARDTNVDSWTLERVTEELAVDWKADSMKGPEGDAFRLAANGACAIRQFGSTGFDAAQQVSFRRYTDEDEEQTIVLEDFGVGREVRVGDPVFEGELRFESDATAAENRPWATAEEEDDAAAELDDEAGVVRGSAVAAALALEGRFVSDDLHTEAFSDTDPFEYADEEWSDARDAAPVPEALAGSADAPNDPRAEWLIPTFWAAGSREPPQVELEDDWLVAES